VTTSHGDLASSRSEDPSQVLDLAFGIVGVDLVVECARTSLAGEEGM
jgi:hypothetical protein